MTINTIGCNNFSKNNKPGRNEKTTTLKKVLTGLFAITSRVNGRNHIDNYQNAPHLYNGNNLNPFDDGNEEIFGGTIKIGSNLINSFLGISNEESEEINLIGDTSGQTVIRAIETYAGYTNPNILGFSSTIKDKKISPLLTIFSNSNQKDILIKGNDHINTVAAFPLNDTYSLIFANYGRKDNLKIMTFNFNKQDYDDPKSYNGTIYDSSKSFNTKDVAKVNDTYVLFGNKENNIFLSKYENGNINGGITTNYNTNTTVTGNSIDMHKLLPLAFGCGSLSLYPNNFSPYVVKYDYKNNVTDFLQVVLPVFVGNDCDVIKVDKLGNQYLGGYFILDNKKKAYILKIDKDKNSKWGVYYNGTGDSEIKEFMLSKDENTLSYTGYKNGNADTSNILKGSMNINNPQSNCNFVHFHFDTNTFAFNTEKQNLLNKSQIELNQSTNSVEPVKLTLYKNGTCLGDPTNAPTLSPTDYPTISNNTSVYPPKPKGFKGLVYFVKQNMPMVTKVILFFTIALIYFASLARTCFKKRKKYKIDTNKFNFDQGIISTVKNDLKKENNNHDNEQSIED